MARFNIMVNPQPSNPGKPNKKYFVGMPIPAGAGVVAAVVHFTLGVPLGDPWMAITWLSLVVAVGYLMVSTWRFYSFKDIHFNSRQPFRIMLLLAAGVVGTTTGLVRALAERDACRFAGVPGACEQAQLDAGGVFREEGEVHPLAIPGGAEWVGGSRPDAHPFRLPGSPHRRAPQATISACRLSEPV